MSTGPRLSPEQHALVRTCLKRAVTCFPTYATAWAMRSLLELDEDRFAFKAKARAYTDRPAASGKERLVQKERAARPSRSAAIRAATETALLVPELQYARLEPFMSDNVMVENCTFAEIEVGESFSLERTVTKQDIELYSTVSGDARSDPSRRGVRQRGRSSRGRSPTACSRPG